MTSTEAIINIVNLFSLSGIRAKINTIDGISVEYREKTDLEITSQIQSLSTRTGGSNGTLVTFESSGFTKSNVIEVFAVDDNSDLLGAELLNTQTQVISYDQLKIWISGEITDKFIVVKVNGVPTVCTNADAEKCKLTLSASPTFDSPSNLNTKSFSLPIANFPSSIQQISVIIGGVSKTTNAAVNGNTIDVNLPEYVV